MFRSQSHLSLNIEIFLIFNYNNLKFVTANTAQRENFMLKFSGRSQISTQQRKKKAAANQAVFNNLINSLTQRKQRGISAFISRIKLPIIKIRKGIRNLRLLQ